MCAANPACVTGVTMLAFGAIGLVKQIPQITQSVKNFGEMQAVYSEVNAALSGNEYRYPPNERRDYDYDELQKIEPLVTQIYGETYLDLNYTMAEAAPNVALIAAGGYLAKQGWNIEQQSLLNGLKNTYDLSDEEATALKNYLMKGYKIEAAGKEAMQKYLGTKGRTADMLLSKNGQLTLVEVEGTDVTHGLSQLQASQEMLGPKAAQWHMRFNPQVLQSLTDPLGKNPFTVIKGQLYYWITETQAEPVWPPVTAGSIAF
jgi:hypothetical protein